MDMFDYNKLEDPGFFGENRLPAHSDHVAGKTEEEAISGKSSFRLSLDGVWKFFYAESPALVPAGFADRDNACDAFGEIRVPSCMQMEGYDRPQYVNTQYPWDGMEEIHNPEVPKKHNPVGAYVKFFTLPEGFLQKDLTVRFEGVESAMALYFNGHYVGYSSDTFDAHDFDLTPYLVEGENKLSVLVFRFDSGSWLEDQDFYRFSGIFRSVFLITHPVTDLFDLRVQTPLADDFSSGSAKLSLKIQGETAGTVEASLYRALLNPETLGLQKDGEAVARASEEITEKTLALSLPVDKPALWSAEKPNLYLCIIRILDEKGNLLSVTAQDVGFRTFSIGKDAIMRLNGKRIVFNGVNRHEFSARFARAITEAEMRTDLLNMKRANINALRMSHYPNQSAMYKLCDRLGIYVIDENNLESHGSWDAYERGHISIEDVIPGDQEKWQAMVLDRGKHMLERDKNHPSVLIWSCGNESFGGSVIHALSNYFREADPTRPVHYEGVCHDRRYNDTSDIESRMYPNVREIEDFLKEHRDKPFICCEYAHAMGNSCGAMFKYTDLTEKDPLYQGGFIWDYIDQAIELKDRYGKTYLGYGGDCTERPTDYDFCGNGIAFADENRTPTPKMQGVKYNYQPFGIRVDAKNGTVTIRNRQLFTDASAYDTVVSVQDLYGTMEREKTRISLAPGEEKTFAFSELGLSMVPAAEWKKSGRTLSVTVSLCLAQDTVYAKAGYEAAFGEAVLEAEKLPQSVPSVFTRFEEPFLTLCKDSSCKVVRGEHNVGVHGRDFDVLFSDLKGGIVSYRYAGKELLETPILPNFWRAPTQNDIGNGAPTRSAQWKIASLYLTTKQDVYTPYEHFLSAIPMEVEEGKNHVKVTFTYLLPTSPKASCRLCFEVYGDGTVRASLSMDPVDLGDLPEFGLIGRMNADYHDLTFYGEGPEETYADKMQGARLGLYRRDVWKELTPYLVPQEAGNHAGCRMAALTDKKGRGLFFASESSMSFSALPWTPHEIENAQHAFELPPVHYTVFRASLAQQGIAGDNTWGALTHSEFMLPKNQKLDFAVLFRGI